MRVIGFDPSNDSTAWASLDCDGSGTRRYVDCGVLEDLAMLADLLARQTPYLVAVERPQGIHMHPRPGASREELHRMIMMARSAGKALMGASYVCGRIVECARWRQQRIIELSPQQWRTALGVSRSTKDTNQDAMVKDAIQTLVDGWPSRSNTHDRDSAGVALAAYWMVRAERRVMWTKTKLDVRAECEAEAKALVEGMRR